jgi:hypothetical protein
LPGPRPARKLLTTLGLTLLAVLALGASAAQAELTHVYSGTSFGPGGVGSGRFEQIIGVTVQQSSGDVFVLDKAGSGRLYKFNAAGEPVDFSSTGTNAIEGVGTGFDYEEQVAVDDSNGPDAGDIYVANSVGVRIYAASGTFLGELTGGDMCGVAVDPSGNVYVGVFSEGTVRRYAPSANPVTSADETGAMGGLGSICNLAVDSAGDVYADAPYSTGVSKYDALQFGSLSASGEFVDHGKTVTVDPTSGEVFIDQGGEIAQYDGSSQPPQLISDFHGGESNQSGVGVDHASGKLYLPTHGAIGIFGPLVTLPDVSTEEAANVTLTEATLHGTVEPAGTEVTSCVFKYGIEGERDHSIPCEPATPYTGNAPVAVSARLAGLATGTRYGYEIVVSNASGQANGQNSFFRTKGPGVSQEGAGSLSTKAVVQAQIYPGGEATTYHVEYGTSSAYGSSTEGVELEASEEPVTVQVPIVGLQPDTTYHFRFITTNGAATATGPTWNSRRPRS